MFLFWAVYPDPSGWPVGNPSVGHEWMVSEQHVRREKPMSPISRIVQKAVTCPKFSIDQSIAETSTFGKKKLRTRMVLPGIWERTKLCVRQYDNHYLSIEQLLSGVTYQ